MTTTASWKQRISPGLRHFLQQQQLFVFLGVVIYVLLSALKLGTSFALIMVVILCLGNTVGPFMAACRLLCDRHPFPWNWAMYLPMLVTGSAVNAVAATALLRWLQPARPSFALLFRQLAPLIVVVSITVGLVRYVISQKQRTLQEKNLQLEQAVERGSVALLQQEQEMDRAREIQQALLPKTLPQLPGVQIAGAWQPAKAVGGDYFDVIRLGAQRLGICIGDVSGKGITAALLMANLQAAFRAFATPEASPAAVCSKLNAFLCGNVAPGKFITFFYAVLDAEQQTLSYENAGHSPGLLVKTTGQAEFLRGGGAVLGMLPEWSYTDSTVKLDAGDHLLLFTDGITEAATPEGEEFGEERLIQAARNGDGIAAHLQHSIMEQVTQFCSANFHDDATLLVAVVR